MSLSLHSSARGSLAALFVAACTPREEGAVNVAAATEATPPAEARALRPIDAGQPAPDRASSMRCWLDFDDGTNAELATPLSITDLKGAWSIMGYDKERQLGLAFSFEDGQVRVPGDFPLPPKYGYDRPRVYVVKFDGDSMEKANMSSTRGGTVHVESAWAAGSALQRIVVVSTRNDEFKVTVRRCELSLVHP